MIRKKLAGAFTALAIACTTVAATLPVTMPMTVYADADYSASGDLYYN